MAEAETRVSLLEKLRDGADAMAWRDFFDRYWRPMFVFAKRCGCSDHTAEDAVQDTILAVYENRGGFRYDPSRGRFHNWLFSIVRQKLALKRRQQAAERHASANLLQIVPDQPSGSDLPDEVMDGIFQDSLLVSLMDVVRREVSPETYQSFEFLFVHGLSGAAVAKLTGLSRNAVYLARKRVLRRLRELGASCLARGQLDQRMRDVLSQLPGPDVERSMATRVETAMSSLGN